MKILAGNRVSELADKIWHPFAANLRYRLLLLVIGPIFLLTLTVIALASYWTSSYTYEQLFLKVNTDLNVAHEAFLHIETEHQQFLQTTVDSHAFRSMLDNRDYSALAGHLRQIKKNRSYAFMNLLSSTADERLTSTGFESWVVRPSSLLERALDQETPATGIEIYSHEDLLQENRSLAESIVIPLVETPRAVPTSRDREDRAMVIRVLQPVFDLEGEVLGILEAGVLLNLNFQFVDEIRDLVYAPESLAQGSRGTVTVFLDDVRISTNVPNAARDRALGTRVSAEVHNTVLQQGQSWVDRAFVVNDWYISAYEPIVDVDGKRVGMLYAGYLDAPFREAMLRALLFVIGVLALGTSIAAVIAWLGAQSVFRPIEAIAKVVRATRSGESRRIGNIDSLDEIGELGYEFDSMLDTLEENRLRIETAAADLELKVAERTQELQQKNIHLQDSIDLLHKTRKQLAMAEKLAALGELTAGVAHEINNPTAVILGNMDVLVERIGPHADGVQVEIDLIIDQVYRIRSIIDRLLQYSRPSEYAGYIEYCDVTSVLKDTLALVSHEVDRDGIQLHENYTDTPPVQINIQELQQVLVNLIINATHAVEGQGQISVSTSLWGTLGVCIKIRDNGAGIEAKDLQRVFDPFYTSGKVGGTGLGLSVSYGIIRRYGGQILVDSNFGGWTEFRVLLRYEPLYEDDDEVLQAINHKELIDA